MSWPWVVGFLYFAVWIIIAWIYLSTSVLLSIGIAVLLSILTTVTDEGAESGSLEFRGNTAAHKACVNIHWALTAFYLSIARGVLFPNAQQTLRDDAYGLMFLAIVFGLIGIFTIRRNEFVAPVLAGFSTAFVLVFGIKVMP